MWNPANSNDQGGQVTARMETTPSLGSASISISQQQAPKKFAPVVAPKPKFNPYKQPEDPTLPDPPGNNTLNQIIIVRQITIKPQCGQIRQPLKMYLTCFLLTVCLAGKK